jgi:uncharacterized protein
VKYLLVLLVVGFVLWSMATRSRGSAPPPVDKRRTPPSPPVTPPQAMVACAHCGLHLPAVDAVLDGSRIYCSPAHRALGPRAPHS